MYGYGAYYGSGWIYVLPGLILAMYAQAKISSAYSKYSKIDSGTGISGAQAAKIIMDKNNLSDVSIKMIGGQLTDNYNPTNKVLSLSKEVYEGTSIASIGIAAHEVGHAIQHMQNYKPVKLRTMLVPAAGIGSNMAMTFILLGLFISKTILQVGIAMFAIAVLFQVVTLPVEFDASRRALQQLSSGILPDDKIKGAREVLKAAALTYVAATLTSIGQLLRLLSLSRRRD
ncbi:zinc metallopeptidase [Peptoniphilus catoniae]|uniref:zinc metallopeptidase n=1 Tax=Peptoniphilus catoniae TaxID=1660341 RepID=UPI0010FDBED8|nr:zinc metallopeptidase [Peptoniphilus catoniae]